jgi:hypothetical protein
VVLEGVFIRRVVNDLNLFLSSILNSAGVRNDSDSRLELRLPSEMEGEFSIILEGNLTNLALVDKELTKVNRESFILSKLSRRANFNLRLAGPDLMMDLVTFSLNVKSQWSSLSLHIADQVVVIG